ncbi:hypothetical protein [Bradyrhizobium lablabi]|uniref:hypothetical protein n=1 Tax=Bradyrhizobium lablabi TaxID=722472 RepID=UPI001BA9B957|nr:hypothetical protein [Bradyrhizobium lablabi]MBR0697787.1 hypothetical protein [Bradyrhizobium lablabi]
MAASDAAAFDWSLKTTQSETVELNSNQFLNSFPAGSIGSYSTLTANAEARTPTSKFNLDGDGSYKKYWGPGVDGVASEYLNYGFRARYEQYEKVKPDREFVEALWRQQSTALALLSDIGASSNTNGFLDTLTFSGGLDRTLSSRDTLSLFATSTRTSYEPSSGGTPFTDTLARGTWRHSLSALTNVNVSSEAEFLNYDNTFGTSIQIYRNQVGIDTTFSPVLSFRGNIGAANLVTENGVATSVIGGTSTTTPSSSSVLDWIGDAVLTYRMLKNTTLTITANQTVGPSIVGSIFKRDMIDASISHIINSRSSITLSANGNRQISTNTTDFASASASYSYNLTQNWIAQFTYRYLHRFASSGTATFDPITGTPTVSGTGPADSHSIMVVVSHSYTLLPPGN